MYASWEEIDPIMTTKWNQLTPYNKYCPTKGYTRCVTGCVATAMAQVIKANGYAKCSGYKSFVPTAVGYPVSFDFDSASFDFDTMPDICSENATDEKSDAVAKLIFACGISVGMNYDTDESGAYTRDVPHALIKYFGYDPDFTKNYDRDRFSTRQWEQMVYTELALGRPVLYDGHTTNSGHAFVVDGYKRPGLYHVNWGWGGMSDGYYSLTALNPMATGTGGIIGGYNYAQGIVRAMEPGDTPGYSVPEMSGSISMTGTDTYAVYFQSLGVVNVDVTLGAVITDSDGNCVATAPFWNNMTITSTGTVYHNSYSYDFSRFDIAPGHYRIYPALAKQNEDDYIITQKFNKRQHYVDLTVTPEGQYIYENLAPSGAEIHISDLECATLYSGYSSKMSISLINNGSDDFSENIYLNLSNDDGNSYVHTSSLNNVIIPSGMNKTINTRFTALNNNGKPLSSGTYRLILTDTDGEVITPENITVEITDGNPNSGYYPNSINVYNTDDIPSIIASGHIWSHIPMATVDREQNVRIEVTFYRHGTNSVAKSYPIYNGILAYSSGMLPIEEAFIVDLPYGAYDVAYTNKRDDISPRSVVMVGEEIDGLYYAPVSASSQDVRLITPPTGQYTGHVTIPATVSISGTDYNVSVINSEAFYCADGLLSLDIPTTVNKIGFNAMSYCHDIEYMFIRSEKVPFTFRNHVAIGLNPEAEIYVPAGSYSDYDTVIDGYVPTYATINSVESKSLKTEALKTTNITLAIEPAHPAVNPGFTVIPAENGYNPAAEMTVIGTDSHGQLELEVRALHEGTASFKILSAQPGVEPATVNIDVTANASVESIIRDSESKPAEYYDINGRRINKKDIREGEIYIINSSGKTNKVLIRN